MHTLATQTIAAITEEMVYEQLELNKLLFDRCWSSAKKVV
jgi:hypothetical protein